MDEQIPTPEPASSGPSSPPPPLRPVAPPVIPAPPGLIKPPPTPPRGGSGWKVLSFLLMGLIVLWVLGRVMVHGVAGIATRGHTTAYLNRNLEEVVLDHTNSANKIAVVEISGVIAGGEADRTGMDLVTYIKEQFRAAESDPDVKAVILKVNSPGGEVMASDEIYDVIRNFQVRSGKPVVVSMGSLAASGGYYVSAPCRWIVASELTITGSIGVIMHTYNYRLLFDKIGIRPLVIKSGRYKDMLSGEKEPDDEKLTPQEIKDRDEETSMVQVLIDETFNRFKDVVKTGRGWAAAQNGPGEGRTLVANWADYADGRILSGQAAYDYGFVDELGNFDTAVNRAKTLTHIPNASLIEYRLPMDLGSVLARMLGKSETPALKVDFGIDLPRLQAGLLYFLTPTAIPH
jgi:protease-4